MRLVVLDFEVEVCILINPRRQDNAVTKLLPLHQMNIVFT